MSKFMRPVVIAVRDRNASYRVKMERAIELPASKIRNRDTVLGAIIPKIFGILCARGQELHGFGRCAVRLTEDIVLSAHPLGTERIMLSVYDVVNSEITKVFSAHVNDTPSGFDPGFFRYQGGRVAILSWRRGRWEDVVIADEIPPRSISEMIAHGVSG
jgi:hypothetical protein